MKSPRKRFLSILLSLCMTLTLVPMAGTTASAAPSGTGTDTDPYRVSSMEDLKTAVETGGYVQLDADITTSSTPEISVSHTTHLDLNGKKLTLNIGAMGADYSVFTVASETFMTVDSSNAGGQIVIIAPIVQRTLSLFKLSDDSSMTINGGTFSYRRSPFHHVYFVTSRVSTSSLTVNDGTFDGGLERAANVTVNGGVFNDEIGGYQSTVFNGGTFYRLVSKFSGEGAEIRNSLTINGGIYNCSMNLAAADDSCVINGGVFNKSVRCSDIASTRIFGGVFYDDVIVGAGDKNVRGGTFLKSLYLVHPYVTLTQGAATISAMPKALYENFYWDGKSSTDTDDLDIKGGRYSDYDEYQLQVKFDDYFIVKGYGNTPPSSLVRSFSVTATNDAEKVPHSLANDGTLKSVTLPADGATSVSISHYDLPQALKDKGYTLEEYVKIGDTYESALRVYYFQPGTTTVTAGRRFKKGAAVIDEASMTFKVNVPKPLTGKITFTSNPVVGAAQGFYESGFNADEDARRYRWQRSADGGTTWSDIPHADSRNYEATTYDLNRLIRVVVTASGCQGSVVSPSRKIVKGGVFGLPEDISISSVNKTAPSFVINMAAGQEYSVVLQGGTPSWNDSDVLHVKSTNGGLYTVSKHLTAGQVYDVYTRYYETETKKAGTRTKSRTVSLKETVPLTGLTAEVTSAGSEDSYFVDSSGKLFLYVLKDETATIRLSPEPANATLDSSTLSGIENLSSVGSYELDAENNCCIVTIHKTAATPEAILKAFKSGLTPTYYGNPISVFIVDSTDDIIPRIDFTEDKVSLTVGDTLTQTVVRKPAASTAAVAYRVATGQESICSVDSATGKVTAKAAGTATIWASINEVDYADYQVTVSAVNIPVEHFSLSRKAVWLNTTNNKTASLTSLFEPVNASRTDVTFETSNPSVATVDTTGKVKAVANGTAVITATAEDGKTARCSVRVGADLAISTTSLSDGTVGTPYSAALVSNPADSQWMTNDALPEGLTLNSSGTISGTPKEAGSFTVTVTASLDGQMASKTLTLTVSPLFVDSADILVTRPVRGAAAANAEVSLSSHCYAANTTWSPSVSTFGGGTAYSVKVELEAEKGYAFADGSDFTVNGASVEPSEKALETASVIFTFPATTSGGGAVVEPSSPDATTPEEETPTATYKSDTTAALSVNYTYLFKITSLNGKAPVFAAGTAGVFETKLEKQSGNDYFFRITAVGRAGQSAGIYINGEKLLLVATVLHNYRSDTTAPLSVKAGASYQFRITSAARPSFAVGTPGAFRVDYAGSKGREHYYRITATGKAGSSAGIYINGEAKPVCIASVK